ncbi:MAG: pantoate--beta-alanine ligase [Nitrospirae bacterium CG_4_10_14_3_um_filter_44_29]|nr:pantoate--beta-alanine ligase [Nitrospirota bacterium]OIO29154.1 MAG: pantoate--beta-alanine ligase [Nitrospirae bacterium CG1_02_44_142]PIP71413.1 MAG: pantoate--beta-alanine ligase [Nitrospirae bacterium CG22_combo_CG10-13_8_21_14_all_44_11]PIV41181.1 MAG: pantoate--beta-alanine ligase [Nitrospirae bacterium CG02_land_8_20_14_3_00_44_33]PIV66812.1 MAG: pantoate--beta-alanine ligase [Nitrospirae bacterium CG01_land_8_20_14_3_00_44_22]PIW89865.1 MAG: pantoate--beta-alanine ligase [Nitrospir
MEIIRIPHIVHDTSNGHLLHGRSIGFVPTMGALHEGHLSLIKRSKDENDITIVSIFVNPLQFGQSEDFNKYPGDIEGDAEKLRKEEVDILFAPDKSLLYPEGFLTRVEVGKLSEKLCGAFRTGHFKGVTTIVAKLFNIVKPTRAYFGQKDFQQAVIIKKMVKDLDMPIDIVVCPTIREHDGLAMSSRNLYLNEEERKAAAVIYRCLVQTSEMIKSGIISKEKTRRFMKEKLLAEPLVREIQYASIYDPETLEEVEAADKEALLAVAVKVGGTRLIDNMLVKA